LGDSSRDGASVAPSLFSIWIIYLFIYLFIDVVTFKKRIFLGLLMFSGG